MNLLLLLSALLSALTGVGAGVRAAQPAVAVTQPAVAAHTSRAVVRAAARPAIVLPRLATLGAVIGVAWRLAPAAPLFLSRRRE
ncbi:hypothetical protein [uncultured Sphingomonas sp.]|uniref:hypothetical protein n=1 Tax=uncultured Sphingomonas sp. TaxID=158754 RepID=UPI0035CB3075